MSSSFCASALQATQVESRNHTVSVIATRRQDFAVLFGRIADECAVKETITRIDHVVSLTTIVAREKAVR